MMEKKTNQTEQGNIWKQIVTIHQTEIRVRSETV